MKNLLKITGLLLACGLAALGAGCSSLNGRPPMEYGAGGLNYKLKSSAHWRFVADELVRQITRIEGLEPMPVQIATDTHTRFGRTLAAQLQQGLAEQGYKPRSDAALVVHVDWEVVQHRQMSPSDPDNKAASTELALMTRLHKDGREVLSLTTLYYVDGIDTSLYADGTRTYKLVSENRK